MANASITVTFVTTTGDLEQNASIQAELDDEMNEGKTRFLFGSKAYYKVIYSPSTMTITQEASDGTITEEGTGTESITENVNFADTSEGSTSYPADSVTSSSWNGNSLGALEAVGNTIRSSQSGVGVLNLTYNVAFRRYAISVQDNGESEYSVLIVITGTV